MNAKECLLFIERELAMEARELRSWAREDSLEAKKTSDPIRRAVLGAQVNGYLHAASQMERILAGKTFTEAMVERLKQKVSR